MWFQKKFSRKLALAFCIAVGSALAFTDFLSIKNLRSHLIQELKDNLLTQARQLQPFCSPEAFVRPSAKWQSMVERLNQETGARVTLIRKDGIVVADSKVPWKEIENVENHSHRPEVMQAYQSGWGSDIRHSHTIDVDLLYVAVPYPSTQNSAGIIRLAIPLTKVRDKVNSFSNIVLTSTFGAIALGLILIFLISRWVTLPLTEITQKAASISEGKMDQRVPVSTLDEVGRLAQTFNLMAEKLEATLKQIQSEKDEIAAILSSMVEQVIAIDDTGRIFLVNPPAEKLFGIRSPEVAGKTFVEVIRQAAISDIFRFVLEQHVEKSEEIRLFLPDERVFEARAVPIQSEGKAKGVLLVLHDITKIQNLERIRRDFVANVSHELRTPLTSIQGFAETLLTGALSDKQHNREFVETIHSEAERLTHIVNDLLDLSAIESGRRKPQLMPVLLQAILKEIEETVKPLLKKQNVTLRSTISPLPEIRGDRDQLKQMFMNLIDNAIKFNSPGGAVNIEAKQDRDAIVILIRDTGIGIAAADLPRIFERFYRADKARSREMGGTGLGLAIVKHIVEAHRGTIQAESVPDQGSTFIITLPIS